MGTKARVKQPWIQRRNVNDALANAGTCVHSRPSAVGELRGLYATRPFAPGDFVASFHGRVIAHADVLRLATEDPALFGRINTYAFEAPGGHLMPEDVDAAGAHLINHSCGPNASFSGVWERGAMLMRAVRPIAAGEEITCHYGWMGVKAALERAWTTCACQAPFCAGTVELRLEAVERDAHLSLSLPLEEVANRFLADVLNDTDEHTTVMLHYARSAHTRLHIDAASSRLIDPWAFHAKLSEGLALARQALEASHGQPSGRRMARLLRAYGS